MRPAELAHEPADVIDVVAHGEFAFDDLGDARAGPQIGFPAVGSCAPGQFVDELAFLLIVEFGWSSGDGFGVERPGAMLTSRFFPPLNGGAVDADDFGDLGGAFSRADQSHGASATSLEFFGCSNGSHGRNHDRRKRE